VVCGVWCVVCGVWCVVCGVWCVVCGVWCVVCGVWCVVCGAVLPTTEEGPQCILRFPVVSRDFEKPAAFLVPATFLAALGPSVVRIKFNSE
jgi:hypothetical protein